MRPALGLLHANQASCQTTHDNTLPPSCFSPVSRLSMSIARRFERNPLSFSLPEDEHHKGTWCWGPVTTIRHGSSSTQRHSRAVLGAGRFRYRHGGLSTIFPSSIPVHGRQRTDHRQLLFRRNLPMVFDPVVGGLP